GRRLDDIWEYVNKGESLGGEICEDVPENIKNLWRNYLAENTSSNTKNKRTINQPTITSHFHSNTPISSAKAHLLDQAILKAWICCGFAFHTIENPFIIDLFQIAAPGYNLPSREKLSGFLLESEAARIEQKVEFELDNLTLKQLKVMKIEGGEIKSYTKTRWGSFCMTVDSIIRSKPVFDWILDNYPSVISNDNVFNYLQNEDFYMKCRQIFSILKPIKELTNILEARSANLADCFIGLVKLAAAINQIDGMNPWKQEITVKFNRRFNEFTNYYYILSYWLHPLYHGKGLKNDVLDKIYEAAASLWKALGYDEHLCIQLLTEMRAWKRQSPPYHLSYNKEKENPTMWWLSINTDKNNDQLQELALHLYAISPSQAVCEQLKYYGKGLNINEIRNNIFDSSVTDNFFDEKFNSNFRSDIINEQSESLRNINVGNMSYDPSALVENIMNQDDLENN
ncbi:17347_t:CDS:2, partial [Entrophospora sp. SA101]